MKKHPRQKSNRFIKKYVSSLNAFFITGPGNPLCLTAANNRGS